MGLRVAYQSHPQQGKKPVIFFNASTRLSRISLNAAYSLLTAWGLQLMGVPVIYFACHAGMSRCVLGTHREDPKRPASLPGLQGTNQAVIVQCTGGLVFLPEEC